MDIRSISSQNLIPIIDPTNLRQSPDEFLAENGGFLSEVAVVGKSTSGFVHFRSATAPTNRDTNEFFSTFSTIADSIGIKVYALVNGLADNFFGKNPSYSAIKDGGNSNNSFVDPFKDSYTTYLKSIIDEVSNHPIQGILLDNIRFPHEEYSFCERCRRSFSSAYGIERMFSLGDIQRDPNLGAEWLNWRKNRIETILRELSQTITLKKDLSVSITIDIDPTLEGPIGALKHFGQDINVIGNYGTPAIHLSAWTPYPASPDASEFQLLIKNLDFVKKYQARTQQDVNLFLWGVEDESILPLINSLKKEVKFKNIFIQNHWPSDYQKRREIHLGLV
ncbi:MAG: hypothetical protein ACTSPM_07890 [Candidatus Heimdallarchaeota archaeon]